MEDEGRASGLLMFLVALFGLSPSKVDATINCATPTLPDLAFFTPVQRIGGTTGTFGLRNVFLCIA